MSREVTPRDWLILGVFSVVLVAGCYAYYRYATAPPGLRGQAPAVATRALQRQSEPQPTPPTDVRAAPTVQQSASPATLPRRDYRFIAERNIFQPPREPAPQAPTRSRATAATAPRRAAPTPGGLSAPPPLPPAPPPLPSPASPPPTSPASVAARPANLTATGVVRMGGDTYVVLENPQTRDTAFVRVGESAFGYQVVAAGDNYVEVRQGDVAYRITLGEGKQERKILATGGTPSAVRPGAPGTPGGPPVASPPSGSEGGRFSRAEGERRRGSPEWVTRVVERWNQLPDFVRNRILERLRENWSQLTPEQQQQVQQALQRAGVTFTP